MNINFIQAKHNPFNVSLRITQRWRAFIEETYFTHFRLVNVFHSGETYKRWYFFRNITRALKRYTSWVR